jgi:predicted house-cleaning noncanonical NTP pyrophosphatase (MazG superfamily)
MTKYNKLVRDKIPEYIIGKGGKPITHIADEKEYWTKLLEKLTEEINEFKENESPEEYADILEVVKAIAEYKGFDLKEVESIREKKAQERGVFKKRIILDES